MEISGLTKQLSELEARIPKLEKDCSVSKGISQPEIKIDWIDDNKQIEVLKAAIKKKQDSLEQASSNAAEIVDQIQQTQNQIANAGGPKLKDQKALGN